MVTKKTNQTDEAVSPVVGVMRMLVVTIIIAAVVSMFASGMMGDIPAPSTTQVKFLGISSTATDIKLDDGLVGLLFEMESGALDLRTLKYYIQDKDYGGEGNATDPTTMVSLRHSFRTRKRRIQTVSDMFSIIPRRSQSGACG